MWYGGWQSDSDYPNDKIYYRTSTDNINWLAPATVLRPADVSPNAYHVNDPTVTKHFNTATSAYQYTMFFTVCMNPCADDATELWSAYLGHASIQTTFDLYGHLMPGNEDEAVALVDSYLERADENRWLSQHASF